MFKECNKNKEKNQHHLQSNLFIHKIRFYHLKQRSSGNWCSRAKFKVLKYSRAAVLVLVTV